MMCQVIQCDVLKFSYCVSDEFHATSLHSKFWPNSVALQTKIHRNIQSIILRITDVTEKSLIFLQNMIN